MSVYSVLRHRGTVKRSVRTFETGQGKYEWLTVGEDIAVLLDASKPEDGKATEFQRTDRLGVLLAGPSTDLRPGDRVEMTRGPGGTFVIKSDPDERLNLHGASHREFVVQEVG